MRPPNFLDHQYPCCLLSDFRSGISQFLLNAFFAISLGWNRILEIVQNSKLRKNITRQQYKKVTKKWQNQKNEFANFTQSFLSERWQPLEMAQIAKIADFCNFAILIAQFAIKFTRIKIHKNKIAKMANYYDPKMTQNLVKYKIAILYFYFCKNKMQFHTRPQLRNL